LSLLVSSFCGQCFKLESIGHQNSWIDKERNE